MDWPRELEEWEVTVSDIRDWTYMLKNVLGFRKVLTLEERALETLLNEKDVLLLAEFLRNHSTVTDRVTVWRRNIAVVSPNHSPPKHPFDSHQCLLLILDARPYIAGEVLGEMPTLDARKYIRSFLLGLLGKPRCDNRKTLEEREVLWHTIHRNLHTEPDDWGDFMCNRKAKETQHRRVSRDEPTNTIYNNTASASPSGLTTTTSSQPYQPPPSRHWH
ncbi:uncharacterized protein EV420DRAFT_1647841 [Desarmillaria tabescens]|uniref:Uncharacterized protein n=1 Tax=Armillaria tabescens TaxID=1929756 RepID=A0AA39JQA0_ARMTA|nr:uncharacterized protein EV420DRAFT_1647841 [Desarmillaria tabescens]KAK0446947.1 hypothetical protein EV420DRAFT_1647841 [Desarmillaria tabescens]